MLKIKMNYCQKDKKIDYSEEFQLLRELTINHNVYHNYSIIISYLNIAKGTTASCKDKPEFLGFELFKQMK